MGGFEGADHVNCDGLPLDMNRVTGHADQVEADHRRAAELGIRVVRESIGWRLAEPAPGAYDFERMLRTARSARDHGIQVLWTLMHYGTPPDLNLHDDGDANGNADAFCERFVRYVSAVAETLAPINQSGDMPPVYNLVNEIGFLAWAASETNMIHPYRGAVDGEAGSSRRSGYLVKRRLVRAVIEGMAAIRRIDPRARFLHVEPLVHVVAPPDQPELQPLADQVRSYQWQVWDMIAGRIEPQFGGDPSMLDLIGINHYHSGQWEVATEKRLWWHDRDPRRLPLSSLLGEAWRKYGRPLMLAETSHFGKGRAQWLHETADEVRRARSQGIPVHGVCLYPLVDRPEWDDPLHWHHSGMWDHLTPPTLDNPDPIEPIDLANSTHPVGRDPIPKPGRLLCGDYAAALVRWQRHLPHPPTEGISMTCLIVFSHLRWNFVYQRPQHLMSRLSEHYRVLFIEEPVKTDGASRLDVIPRGPTLEVLVPHTPIDAAGFHDDQLAAVQGLLADHLQENAIDDYVAWFYTPMALPLLAPLQPRAVIYDCMDELSAFWHAPRQLRQRETALMKMADFVLTGGPALYEAKCRQHPQVYCLPSSVDAAHFSPTALAAGSEHAVEAEALHAGIAHPRLGFFGVIDERFDLALLQTVAHAHPEWQLVMVGPVVKIDPARLPQAPNIHWLGIQSYDRLPYLLAQWDLCLMPFALNESTRYISPTKTLEYMAGEKPIVSTPVHDVIGLYGDTVRIAPAGPAFVRACEEALAEERSARNRRIGEMLATVQRSSWDRSAASVHQLIEEELSKSSPTAAPRVAKPTGVPVVPVAATPLVAPPARVAAAIEVASYVRGLGVVGSDR